MNGTYAGRTSAERIRMPKSYKILPFTLKGNGAQPTSIVPDDDRIRLKEKEKIRKNLDLVMAMKMLTKIKTLRLLLWQLIL